MKMYVGNLSFQSTKEDIEILFGQYGGVADVYLPEDRETGRLRGFAFVTMESQEAMEAAIAGLDGSEFAGRTIKVNEARPREERGGGGGGGGGGRRSGGGGGGRGGYDRDRGGRSGGGGWDRGDRGGNRGGGGWDRGDRGGDRW